MSLGLLCGPIFGSILYYYAGYQFPFYLFGALLLIFSLLFSKTLPSDPLEIRRESQNRSNSNPSNKGDVSHKT